MNSNPSSPAPTLQTDKVSIDIDIDVSVTDVRSLFVHAQGWGKERAI